MRRLRENPQDGRAWEEFISTYGSRIDAWCRRWNLQEADVQDVTQDILLKLAKQFERFEYDPSKSFRKWLRTVTQHALSDFESSRKKRGETVADELLQRLETRQELLDRLSEVFDLEVLSVARTRVESSIESLHWRVFLLSVDDAMTGSDVAEQTGMSVANVYKIKSRVQKQIRDEIRKLNDGDCVLPTE